MLQEFMASPALGGANTSGADSFSKTSDTLATGMSNGALIVKSGEGDADAVEAQLLGNKVTVSSSAFMLGAALLMAFLLVKRG